MEEITESNHTTISDLVLWARTALGMTQVKFAKILSCSRQRIVRAEKDQKSTDQELVYKMYVLMTTIQENDKLFGFKEFQMTNITNIIAKLCKYVSCADTDFLLEVMNE